MRPSPEFKKLFNRAVKLLIQEIRDGCVECIDRGHLCDEHQEYVMDLVMNPRKHVEIVDGKVRWLE